MTSPQIKVACMSNAGGTGKTTLTINLANELSMAGRSVCLFGLDPNASLAMFLGIPNPGQHEQSLGAVLDEKFSGDWPLFDCWPGQGKNVQAILSGADLADNIEKLSTADRRTDVLRDRLDDYPLPHDFLFYDCPGTVDLIHKVALSACDYVLIPIQPDAKGVFAVASLLSWFYENVRRLRLRPEPKILGVIPNRVQAIAQHQSILGARVSNSGTPSLPELLGPRGITLFSAIKEYADISKAALEGGLPLRSFRPGHQANALFREIADVLIKQQG